MAVELTSSGAVDPWLLLPEGPAYAVAPSRTLGYHGVSQPQAGVSLPRPASLFYLARGGASPGLPAVYNAPLISVLNSQVLVYAL